MKITFKPHPLYPDKPFLVELSNKKERFGEEGFLSLQKQLAIARREYMQDQLNQAHQHEAIEREIDEL